MSNCRKSQEGVDGALDAGASPARGWRRCGDYGDRDGVSTTLESGGTLVHCAQEANILFGESLTSINFGTGFTKLKDVQEVLRTFDYRLISLIQLSVIFFKGFGAWLL